MLGIIRTREQQVTRLASLGSEAQAHVCLPVRGAPCWVLFQHCFMLRLYFSSSCVVSRAFSAALCVYSRLGYHRHPISYLCAKFRFFRGLHWGASPWRKIAYSITHPAYLIHTSNVTGRHRGPKRKLRAGYTVPSPHPGHSLLPIGRASL